MNERANTVTTPITDGHVSEAVVQAISQVNGVDPLELGSPLYDAIDPDALDRLFRPTPTTDRDIESKVSFTIAGCEVTVTDNRVVAAKRLSPVDT